MSVARDDAVSAGDATPASSIRYSGVYVWIRRLIKSLDILADAVLFCAFVAELLIMLGNLIGRSFLSHPFDWNLEAGSIALVVMAFFGGARAYSKNTSISINIIERKLDGQARVGVRILADAIVFVTALLLLRSGVLAIQSEQGVRTPLLGLPQGLYGLTLAISMGMVCLYSILRQAQRGIRALITGCVVTVLLAVAYEIVVDDIAWNTPAGVTAMCVAAVIAVLANVPLAFVFAIAATVFVQFTGSAPLVAVQLTTQNSISSYVLLAIPFFILAGHVMGAGGLGARLAALAGSTVSRQRGGLLAASVGAMFVFSGVSGAKVADIAAVGTAMRPMLEEDGYDPAESAAVFGASAAMGETIPPSVALLILSSFTDLSPGRLFVGGVIPAFVLAVVLVLFVCYRNNVRVRRQPSQSRLILLIKAVPIIVIPLVLAVGLISGIATPTELSAVAVVYAVLASLAYRQVRPRQWFGFIADSTTLAGMILMIVATAGAFTWSLSFASVPEHMASLISDLRHPFILMLLTIVVLPIVGCILEGLPALLVFAPLLMPEAQALGINPLQYGILLVIVLGGSAFAPPVGVGFLAACSIFDVEPHLATRKSLVYMSGLLIGCVAIAAIPQLTTVLPDLFGTR